MTQRLKELSTEMHDRADAALGQGWASFAVAMKGMAWKLEAAIAPQWQPAPVPICDTIESYWVATEDRTVYLAHWIKRIAPGAGSSKFVLIDDTGLLITKPITHFMPAEFPEPPGGVG